MQMSVSPDNEASPSAKLGPGAGMRLASMLAAALAVTMQVAAAQTPVFDLHVHLWNDEASLRAYEEQLKAGRQAVVGFGAMWFGGPNQALAGHPERVRNGNNSVLALAVKHPEVMPIATVHPYDGPAALGELKRVAARGIKVLELHPHTQKFDPADSRVLSLVRTAGAWHHRTGG
jgi:uncharacterized protein